MKKSIVRHLNVPRCCFQTFSLLYLCHRFGGRCRLDLQVKFLSLLSIEPSQSNAIGPSSQLLPSPLSKVLATISASCSIFFSSIRLSVFLFYILVGGSKSKLVPLWQRNPFSVSANNSHSHSSICPASGFSFPSLHISSFEITLGRKISKPYS